MTRLDNRIAALKAAGRGARARGEGLGAVALRRAAEDPGRIVVFDGDRAVSRGEMLDLALRLGGALLSRGIEPGAAIAFQLPNWWEACVVNLAAALFGYRLVPLLTMYRAAELGVILPACEVEAVFIPARIGQTGFAALYADLPGRPRHVFTLRGEGGTESFESLLRHAPATPVLPAADDAKIALFTSGSTGRPKAVLHSHAGVDELIAMLRDFWAVTSEDRFYVPSPIGHIGGSIYAFEFPWITGCQAVLAERWDADLAVREMEARGTSVMAGATPFLVHLLAASERAGTRLPALRRFVCGGASVSPDLVRRGLDRFETAVVSRAYGSTEVPVICPGIRTRGEAERHADTDGECEAEVRLLTPEGEPVAEGSPGEIAARAPRMLLGYLDPADEEGAFTSDGFFRMGDLGRRVEGRYLEITGRTKDIIIRKGENLSPLEIENALARHPAVRQSAVVGIPDPERGEMVVAFVVPQEGAAFDFTEMTGHLAALGLARQKFPERLEVVPSLPVNSIGKVQKPALRLLALAQAEGTR